MSEDNGDLGLNGLFESREEALAEYERFLDELEGDAKELFIKYKDKIIDMSVGKDK